MDETRQTRFQEDDARPGRLQGLTVAILGFGNQGHAHALNLRDSGVNIVVGARPEGRGAAAAREVGFEVRDFAAASRGADVVMMLLPDEIQRRVYEDEVEPNCPDHAVLGFAHGFALAFDLIRLPADRRAMLVAPKGQGHKLREAYVAGGGLPGLIAIEGPDQEDTLELALAYAHACGALKGGGFLSTFREEAVSDQFGEQAVLCGGLVELIEAAWEVLVDRGHSPEVAYFECLHEVKLIVDLIHEHGIDGMRQRISTTAAWGGLQAGPRVIGPESRRAMKELLERIEDGSFAREFLDVQSDGGERLRQEIARKAEHPIVGTGHGLREFLMQCRLDQTSGADQREERK
ncbi:ketol-acid reductoisomerase [bacterium]|nr:MAG: ketol-acid reductoisomerase [bacterium]